MKNCLSALQSLINIFHFPLYLLSSSFYFYDSSVLIGKKRKIALRSIWWNGRRKSVQIKKNLYACGWQSSTHGESSALKKRENGWKSIDKHHNFCFMPNRCQNQGFNLYMLYIKYSHICLSIHLSLKLVLYFCSLYLWFYFE